MKHATPPLHRLFLILSLLLLAGSPAAAWDHLRVETPQEGGWRVVTLGDAPIVLAFGEQSLDQDHLSPEFCYLLDCYDAALQTDPTLQTRNKLRRKVQFSNISTLLRTTWAQNSPYNNMCPLYNGGTSRCVTGCVATAMAQVLNYHQLPKTMRGSKTYGYVNKEGKRVSHSFDYGATTFDWANMKNSYSSFASTASKNAVATLMYACGVATNMNYSPSESGANPWVGADGINCFMDGIRAEYKTFSSDDVLLELQASRPVIFSGTNPNTGGAHCFVIDGARSDGYFHCNLGWGGGNDGYYLPTDMAGYSKSQDIVRLWPSDERPSCTPIAELRDKYALARWEPVTSLEVGRWYALWNAGRAGSPFSQGQGQTVLNTSMLPTGESTIYNAAQLIRLVRRSSGGYYIQTGIGDYWGGMSAWGGECRTTANGSAYFSQASIYPGYWSINVNSQCYVDTNGPGGGIVGWNTAAPTDTVSNSSWRILPVTLSDDEISPSPLPEFDAAKRYTLRNTGYSQGYLVAVSQDDAHPTLRGVTQDHANGLYPGALYHDEADLEDDGAHWRILTESGQQYLQNVLTGKYLTHEGDQKPYIFTTTKRPIHIAAGAGGTYTFNASTDSKSYLCAATNVENPAAFWEATDEGSIWTVEEAPQPDPLKGVTYATITSLSELGDPLAAYTLQNTGYSQGYLVATSTDDTHPTLRGVTHDHSNGLYSGALYHEEADLRSPLSYWQIVQHEGAYYLYNVGTQQFLSNEGVRTCYVFTSEPKPMRIGLHSGGTLWFSSDNDTQSYLCAATQLPNPAAWYTQNDPGSIWLVKRLTAGLDLPTADPFSTTGIDGAPEASPSIRATMYDLQGRAYPAQGHTRGTTRQRGLYIMQGRKVVK